MNYFDNCSDVVKSPTGESDSLKTGPYDKYVTECWNFDVCSIFYVYLVKFHHAVIVKYAYLGCDF